MRLIDADVAQKIADLALFVDDAGTVQHILSHTPTIDAVPVVRCKDCKRFAYDKGDADYYCTISTCVVSHNDFCSYGERKDGDG